jgi:hypothetical protein
MHGTKIWLALATSIKSRQALFCWLTNFIFRSLWPQNWKWTFTKLAMELALYNSAARLRVKLKNYIMDIMLAWIKVVILYNAFPSKKILTLASIIRNRLFPVVIFFKILVIWLFTITHPWLLCTEFWV